MPDRLLLRRLPRQSLAPAASKTNRPTTDSPQLFYRFRLRTVPRLPPRPRRRFPCSARRPVVAVPVRNKHCGNCRSSDHHQPVGLVACPSPPSRETGWGCRRSSRVMTLAHALPRRRLHAASCRRLRSSLPSLRHLVDRAHRLDRRARLDRFPAAGGASSRITRPGASPPPPPPGTAGALEHLHPGLDPHLSPASLTAM